MLSNFIDAPLGAFSPCSYCRIVDALMSRNAANAAWLAFVCVRIILICPSVYFFTSGRQSASNSRRSGLRDQSFPVRPVLGQGSSLVNQRGLSLAGKLFAALNPSGPHSVRYSAALRSCGSLILGVRRQASGVRRQASVSRRAAQKKGHPIGVALFICYLLFGGAGGNRTRVRQQSICRSTCLAIFINLSLHSPIGRT